MGESWQAKRLLIENQIAQIKDDLEAHERALHEQGALLARADFVLREASNTGPLAGKLARYQIEINILKERADSFEERLAQNIASHDADLTILKSIAAQMVERDAGEKLKGDRRLQIDLENTKGKWIVVALIVTNLFTLLALLLKQ
jgi:hypothetical protein